VVSAGGSRMMKRRATTSSPSACRPIGTRRYRPSGVNASSRFEGPALPL
jgi:hypothetical protein